MNRRWFHAGGRYDGMRVVCRECGCVLDEHLTSPAPCSLPTTSLVEVKGAEGVWWFINVWNCRAALEAWDEENRPVKFEVRDPNLEEQIDRAARRAVDEQGSITCSGWYSVPDDLARLIEKGLADGRIAVSLQQ